VAPWRPYPQISVPPTFRPVRGPLSRVRT
jgi:hypothetical protein